MTDKELQDIDYQLLERAVLRLKEQGVLLPGIINFVTRTYMGWDAIKKVCDSKRGN